ncbi:MAG TPA: phosphate ABC transporter substrate-binding protein PstS [Actinomycetota bacterium]|nr:phosphate ABC transporter substrate-binding protein PstS [Actinomycetota bacterium]
MRRLRQPLVWIAALMLLAAGCGQGAEAPASPVPPPRGDGHTVSGAGATFPAPIYEQWFEQFPRTTAGAGAQVRYEAVGSGKGITAFTERRVDFGATDIPLSAEELAKAEAAGGAVVHIPTVLGAITVAYNLPGAPRLRMDAELIAELFLGEITSWRDPRVAAMNPGVRLPDLPVSVAHRSDSSGTTANFTAFLADKAPEFGRRVGQGKVVEWPTGEGAEGNDGVAGAVKKRSGAVGYVELTYAIDEGLPVADVRNIAGQFVPPTPATVAAAAEDMLAASAGDFALSLLHTTGRRAYPIASYTYLLVFARQDDPVKGRLLSSLLQYMAGPGQATARRLHYTPVPRDLRQSVAAKVRLLHDPDGRLLSS